MNHALRLLLAALLLPALAGCPPTEATDDDDDTAPDDDDDATPSTDDDDTVADDDDTAPDDDDAANDGVCAPATTLDCGGKTTHSANNGGAGSTNLVNYYSCLDGETWTGPEYAYSFTAPADGEYTVTLTGFTGDLELMLLADTGGDCSGSACLDQSINPPDNDEEVTWTAVAGDAFFIVVDGWQAAISDYELALTCPASGDDDDAVDDDDSAR